MHRHQRARLDGLPLGIVGPPGLADRCLVVTRAVSDGWPRRTSPAGPPPRRPRHEIRPAVPDRATELVAVGPGAPGPVAVERARAQPDHLGGFLRAQEPLCERHLHPPVMESKRLPRAAARQRWWLPGREPPGLCRTLRPRQKRITGRPRSWVSSWPRSPRLASSVASPDRRVCLRPQRAVTKIPPHRHRHAYNRDAGRDSRRAASRCRSSPHAASFQ